MSKLKKGEKPINIHKHLSNKVSLSTIKRWNKSIKLHGSIKFAKQGRPLSVRNSHFVKKVKKEITKVGSQRKVAQKLQISQPSVHRILKQNLQLKPYKMRVEPHLTFKQIEQRQKFVNWVRNHLSKNDTLKILFSDEKQFDIDGVYNSQNDRIWALNREQADSNGGLKQKRKFPQRVMVWMGFCSRGLTPLVIIENGTINTKVYIENILPVARDYGNEQFGDDWIFQQDGASCHTSHDSQNWCQENLPGFIPKDIWPANSPDLNPLDYSIWNQMVQEMNWNAIKSKQTLIKQLYIARNKIQAHQILDISNKWYSRVRNLQINNYKYIQ
ncbi:hypothetical protein ABPG72_012734 [Tetrahymena utriculariae]